MNGFFIRSFLVSVMTVMMAVLIELMVPMEVLIKFGETGGFVSAYGTVYGVILGFVVIEVWNQFNRTQGMVDEEALELESLYQMAEFIKENEVADEVRKNIVEYVESILEKHTTYNKSLQSRKGSVDRLDDLSETISRLILNSSRDLVVFEHLVNQYRRFRDARGKRNRNSDFRLPDALNRFLQMSSFLIIAVFMLVGYQSLLSSVVSVGALTFLLTFVHLIILDLDDPLSGYWRIEFESFSLLKSRLDGK